MIGAALMVLTDSGLTIMMVSSRDGNRRYTHTRINRSMFRNRTRFSRLAAQNQHLMAEDDDFGLA